MAISARVVKVFVTGTRDRIDGLCETCWNPSLERLHYTSMSVIGVRTVDKTYCRDCRNNS